jgi:hypothetical protein
VVCEWCVSGEFSASLVRVWCEFGASLVRVWCVFGGACVISVM